MLSGEGRSATIVAGLGDTPVGQLLAHPMLDPAGADGLAEPRDEQIIGLACSHGEPGLERAAGIVVERNPAGLAPLGQNAYAPHGAPVAVDAARQLEVADTLRRRPVVRDRHWRASTKSPPYVPEHRIPKLNYGLACTLPFRRVPDLAMRLRWLLRSFAAVSDDDDAGDWFPFRISKTDRLQFHRLNEHYRPALVLARLLLAYLSPNGALGRNQFLALLVDMNRLFERFVTVTLPEKGSGSPGIRVAAQDEHPRDIERAVTVVPDVVFYRDARPCLILDAKHKRGEHNADLYQALAYAHALSVRRVVLAYPTSEWVGVARHRIRPDAGIEIVPILADLSGGIDDLRQQTAEFAERVWREL